MFQELVSNITNVGVFTESFGEWISGISINSAIVFIMMIFMLVGAIDKIAGNKRGYGEKFDEGFNAMGPLAAAMAGSSSSSGSVYYLKTDHRSDLYSGWCRPFHVRNDTACM